MLIRNDLIELSHITNENSLKFGCTFSQCQYLNDLLYRSPMKVHNYVLDKLYSKSGGNNIKFHLTKADCAKLIIAIENNTEFQFVEWDSEEWHEFKLQEKQQGLKLKPYVDYTQDLENLNNNDNPTGN